MKFDLTTQEGRTDAITELTGQCKREFIKRLKDISTDAIFKLSDKHMEISLMCTDESDKHYFGRAAFASEVTLYDTDTDFRNKEACINFGSAGSFNPTVLASYWRTIHAATLLKKWDITTNLLSKYCLAYKTLVKEILLANPKETVQ